MNAATESRIRAAFSTLADELVAALADVEPEPDQPVRLLTVDEARAALGGIARSTIYDLIADDRLRTVTVGRRRLVPSSAIAEYAAGTIPRGNPRP